METVNLCIQVTYEASVEVQIPKGLDRLEYEKAVMKASDKIREALPSYLTDIDKRAWSITFSQVFDGDGWVADYMY